MKYKAINYKHLSINAHLSVFDPGNGTREIHCTLSIFNPLLSAEIQFKNIETAISLLKSNPDLQSSALIWKRYFVSDAVNQEKYIAPSSNEAVSVIQQSPLDGTKVAVWLYFVDDAAIAPTETGATSFQSNHYRHYIHSRLHSRSGDINLQTDTLFDRYTKELTERGLSLKNNCIRTWIYVQNIDTRYEGMVAARKQHFEKENMRPETHYIASTGIEGSYVHPDVFVCMDMYAIEGILPEQVRHLHAPTHLNPTYEYGVTFERGTTVDYGDRRHIFISGTASINNKGEIVHPLDVVKQTKRTLENIRALLNEAKARIDDVTQMIVYLRDISDYQTVRNYLDQHHPEIPRIMVWAPVCRPGWLVEIECIAIKKIENNPFGVF